MGKNDVLESEEVVLARFGKVKESDDTRVRESSHDLYFFQNIGSLIVVNFGEGEERRGRNNGGVMRAIGE